MKKNIIWRAAVVLLALTMATLPLTATNAKYSSYLPAHAGEIKVFHLLPSIERADTASSAQKFDPYSARKGYWAYFLKGENGAKSSNGSGAGGAPGIVMGVYNLSADAYFLVGKTRGGAGQGQGGNGGGAEFIIQSTANTASHTNNPAPSGTTVIAVAGGGGGTGSNGSNNKGGHAGASIGSTGSVTMPGPQNGSGSWGGAQGGNTGGVISTSNNSQNGGGGDGSTYGRKGVASGTYSDGTDGNWFQTGSGGNGGGSIAYSGGGGGGIYGGGGGATHSSNAGSGGGGGSYSAGGALPNTTTSATGYTMTKYGNPTSYYQHAFNYFVDRVNAQTATQLVAVLVWLGPA